MTERTKRPRQTVVLENKDGAWEFVLKMLDGSTSNPKNSTEAQGWVNAGKYGEGTFWVLSTLEKPTAVQVAPVSVVRYTATTLDPAPFRSLD